ncbi:MAG: hypothetical protein VCE43_21925, partial [Myxococcota bacterium]
MMVRRVLLFIAAVPLAFVLGGATGSGSDGSPYYSGIVSCRLTSLLRQLDTINDGHYLGDGLGGSFTRETFEAIGPNMLLANTALVRNALGMRPPTWHHIVSWPAWLAALVVAAMVLARAPNWIVGLALVVLWLYPTSMATRMGQRAWPQLFCLILSAALLAMSARVSRLETPTRADFIRIGVVAFVAGCLSQLRFEARLILLLPFLGLFVLNLSLALFGRLRPTDGGEARTAPFRAPWPAETRAEWRFALIAGVVLLGITASSLVEDLNLRVFEAIEDTDHHPIRGRHLFWHPLYLGMGFHRSDQENIAWEDPIGIADAHAATASFTGYDTAYDEVIRDRYREIWQRNTPFALSVYLDKARRLALHPRHVTTTVLLGLALGLGALAFRSGVARNPGGAALVLGATALVV